MPKSILVKSMPVTKSLSLVHLARDTASPGQAKHAFLIVEIYQEDSPDKLKVFEAHLAFTKEQAQKLRDKPESESEFMLTKHEANVVFISFSTADFLKRRNPEDLIMESFQLNGEQRDKLLQLIQTQKEITARPETQAKLSAVGKGGASGLSQENNCYTWSVQILKDTGLPVEEHDALKFRLKDSIAVDPAAHLAAEEEEEKPKSRFSIGSGCPK